MRQRILGDTITECSECSFQLKFKMARNVVVTSLLVALCLVAAVSGHSTYGIGGHRPVVHGSGVLGGVHGGVHGGVLGGSHSGVLGGVHGGVHGGSVHGVGLVGSGIHGAGLVGSGIHGAGSFNTAHYPGLVPGYSFYDQRPCSDTTSASTGARVIIPTSTTAASDLTKDRFTVLL
ncbi:shematrin-like protein 2 [Penaeus chinensis]|uniref:shematrin-like protein 2 n=1 Tax=Penaeus chinensis TaxID=139456 RepID=UPI001FB667A7|nr:shematrin-like protein 2 [Penaeus chinensis]